jgi:hypothetical protein
VREARKQRPHRFGRAQDAERELRRNPERPLRPDERPEQVGPAVPDRELDELPVGSTISAASTWFDVNPYFRQCAPPEFSATLPPIVQTCCDDGSGA